MTAERDFERYLQHWMEPGMSSLSDSVLGAVLDELPTTTQRRPLLGPRGRLGRGTALVSLGFVAGLLLAAGTMALLWRPEPVQPLPTMTPLPTLTGVPLSEFGDATRNLPAEESYIIDAPFPIGIAFDLEATNWQVYSRTPDVVWIGARDNTAGVGFWSTEELYRDPCHWNDGLLSPQAGPAPADFIGAMRRLPGLSTTNPVPVEVGGIRGVQVQVDAGDTSRCEDGTAVLWWAPSHVEVMRTHQIVEVTALDVAGKRLVMMAWTWPDTDPKVLGQRNELIDSISFGAAP